MVSNHLNPPIDVVMSVFEMVMIPIDLSLFTFEI